MTEEHSEDQLRLARIRVRTARRTVLFFFLFGAVWILTTDHLATALLPEQSLFGDDLQTIKGMLFILLSCVLIYFSIIRHAEQILASEASSRHRLRHTEREFRTMVETMGEGVCTLDVSNRLVYANRRFCEITGFRFSEIVRADLFEILSAPRPEGGKIIPGVSELIIRNRNGDRKLISINAVPRHDDGEQPVGTLCVINDLTNFRRAEDEKERLHAQLDQMKRIESLGTLAGKMAHEFNNVMAGILPFTELIEKKAPHEETILSATRYIRQAVNRGRRVSQEVLRFARPMPLARERIEVLDLVSRIEEIAEPIFDSDQRLRTVVSPRDEIVEIDLEQIEQVLTNLFINARDAMDGAGTVELNVDRDAPGTIYDFGVIPHPEQFIHVQIRDDGCGIPEAMRSRIFEPFVTTKRRGTGLGLAITYQIIANHGGHLFAESVEGEGTTFHLFLPIAT